MKKIVIAGGTGFLGKVLVTYWKKSNYEIHILSRKHHLDHDHVNYHKWDGKHLGYWTSILENAAVLINLNGKSVDCRYTDKNKERIYDTRIEATYILGKAVLNCNNPPKLWINAASATIYRHSEDKEMDEASGELGKGFSVDVCKKWEETFHSFELPSTRQVLFRIGIVLGKHGGPMKPLTRLARLGFGGKQGSGKQYFSWIHEHDLANAFSFIILHTHLSGVFNLTVPEPITNKRLMNSMRKANNRKFGLPMPKWLLALGALLIRTETELLLKSRRVVPKRLLNAGFNFKFDQLDNALIKLLNN